MALKLQKAKKTDQLVFCRGYPGKDIGARHVSVPLSVLERIADREEVVSGEDESLQKALLAKGPAKVMDAEGEQMLRGEALTKALKRAIQEVMRLGLLQNIRDLVLREAKDMVCLALEKPMRLWQKPAAHGAKAKPRIYLPKKTTVAGTSGGVHKGGYGGSLLRWCLTMGAV